MWWQNVPSETFTSAFMLSGSLLKGNNNMKTMTLFTGVELTTLGAKALGKAIRRSQLQELHLENDFGGQWRRTNQWRAHVVFTSNQECAIHQYWI